MVRKGVCLTCCKEFKYYTSQNAGKYCSIQCSKVSRIRWENISRAIKNINQPQRFKIGHKTNLGRKHEYETRLRNSISKSGDRNPMFGVSGINSPRWKGGKPKCDCGKVLSAYKSKCCARCNLENKNWIGKNHPNWRGGITPVNTKIRNSLKYKRWRARVFRRDRYTCQICFSVGGALEADHIKQFAYFPKLRFKLSNGRTLCKDCHKIITKKQKICKSQYKKLI